jgi:hypothetical protein
VGLEPASLAARDSTPLQDRTWYRVLLRAPCPVCLLPEIPEPAARPADTALEQAPEDDAALAAGTRASARTV